MHSIFCSFENTIFEDGILNLFGLSIRWYAICIMFGVMLALIHGLKRARKAGIPSDYIYTGLLIILPIAILGARLWYVLFNIEDFHSLKQVLGLDGNGLAGLAIHGGVIFAVVAVYFYCKARKLSLFDILDLVAPGFLLGQICGRWGNFFNSELYGPKINNVKLFKTLLPEFITENMYINGFYRHPTFLYESSLNFLGLMIMFIIRKKWKKLKTGDLVGFYLIWYGFVRIFTETLRSQSGANEILKFAGLPVSILVSISFILGGALFLIIKRKFGIQKYYHELLKEVEENRYDTILFDLDGTLLNTRELINRSFVYTFSHFRPDYVLSDEELDSFFGPPLKQTFARYSEDPKEIEAMIQYYREFNMSKHDEMVDAFPNAKVLMKKLYNKGYKLGVVSSKKRYLVEHGLDLFGLLDKMIVVICEEDVSNPKPDPEGILRAMMLLDSKKALYVGDAVSDILAGKNAGIDTVGVLYSERKDAIIAAEPTYTIKDLIEILTVCKE